MHGQDDPRIAGRNETPVQTPLTDRLGTLGSASLEFIERTEDTTVDEVGDEHDEGRLRAIMERHEAWRLQQSCRLGLLRFASHARM